MYIITEETPNPAVMKFIPGKPVMKPGETFEFASAAEAVISPPASALFELKGVCGVFYAEDFISVTKDETVEFSDLRLDIIDKITDFYLSGENLFSETPQSQTEENEVFAEEDAEIVTQIKAILETRIRPAVAKDGGDIVFQGYTEGVVTLKMKGACAGCPSSLYTLKQGVENMLKHYVPEVIAVQQS